MFQIIILWLKENCYNFLVPIGLICFAFVSITTWTVINGIIFIIGGLAVIFGQFGLYKKSKELRQANQKVTKLESDLESSQKECQSFRSKVYETQQKLRQANQQVTKLERALDSSQKKCQSFRSEVLKTQQDSVKLWLKVISKHLGLNHDTRVSIYYENNENFYVLSRYSLNPILAKIHKQKFPLNKGVISQAWQHGEYSEDECLEYKETSPDEYIAYMTKKYDYDADTINNINMKSCRYFALAIAEVGDNIGVILFESDKTDSFSDDMKDKIKSYHADYHSYVSFFVRNALAYDKSANLAENTSAGHDHDKIISFIGDSNE